MGSDKFSIAEAIRGNVGEASIAAMDALAPAMHAERTIENITEEIIKLKTDAGNAILGIGQRLLEAKGKMQHGEWTAWLAEQVDFSERIAQQYMQLYQGYAANPNALSDLGKTKALKLLSMPREERDEFLEAHDVPNMSTRELEDAIRERDEARKAVEALSDRVKTLEAHNTDLETRALNYSNQNDDLKERIKELESAPKDLYKDEAAIKAAADEARAEAKKELEQAHQARLDAENEVALLQKELAGARTAARSAQEAGAMDEDAAAFRVHMGILRDTVNRLRGLVLKVRSRDQFLADKMEKRLDDLLFEVS